MGRMEGEEIEVGAKVGGGKWRGNVGRRREGG